MRTVLFVCSLLAVAVALISCSGGFNATDAASLRSAEEQVMQIYDIPVEGGSPARAEARGAYCSVDSVLRHLDAGSFDSGGAITCVKPKP
jgi:hypothetical protein